MAEGAPEGAGCWAANVRWTLEFLLVLDELDPGTEIPELLDEPVSRSRLRDAESRNSDGSEDRAPDHGFLEQDVMHDCAFPMAPALQRTRER